MRFLIIILAFVILSTTVLSKQLQPPLPTDHKLMFAEFEAREQLMLYQINLWELFDQLQYADDELRLRVMAEIHEVQKLINNQILLIIELHLHYHTK